MIYELKCGDIIKSPNSTHPKRNQFCATHGATVVVAIECREWHRKCGSCRSGKWYGQNRPWAYTEAVKHAVSTGHRFTEPQYQVYERTYKALMFDYAGHRIRKWVLGTDKPKAVDTKAAIPEEPNF